MEESKPLLGGVHRGVCRAPRQAGTLRAQTHELGSVGGLSALEGNVDGGQGMGVIED